MTSFQRVLQQCGSTLSHDSWKIVLKVMSSRLWGSHWQTRDFKILRKLVRRSVQPWRSEVVVLSIFFPDYISWPMSTSHHPCFLRCSHPRASPCVWSSWDHMCNLQTMRKNNKIIAYCSLCNCRSGCFRVVLQLFSVISSLYHQSVKSCVVHLSGDDQLRVH